MKSLTCFVTSNQSNEISQITIRSPQDQLNQTKYITSNKLKPKKKTHQIRTQLTPDLQSRTKTTRERKQKQKKHNYLKNSDPIRQRNLGVDFRFPHKDSNKNFEFTSRK